MVRQMIERGVCDFVLSPGSRNAPLSIALFEAEEAGLINLYVRIDERGAAFFALGLSKASNNYVVVICTSGTAAANFHPAALEAYHSATKLLVITADRPAYLRRSGANQTTLQVGLLSPLESVDIASPRDISEYLLQGPIHLNMQFDEPLLSEDHADWLEGLSPLIQGSEHPLTHQETKVLSAKSHGVVIVGHDRAGISPDRITELASELGWPIIAEDPLSFSTAISHAPLFLSDEKICASLKLEQIIVIGRVGLSRSISTFIKECNDVIVIDPRVFSIDTERKAPQVFMDIPQVKASVDFSWIPLWGNLSDLAASSLNLDWSEQRAIRAIGAHIPAGSAFFVGSSRPVRDIEAFCEPRQGITTFANRGLAGIDGNISTAFGIAEKFDRTFALLGDLTFLHDISALVNPSSANLTIFIIDNNGGGIFNTLPQAGVGGFEKIFGTAHNLDIAEIINSFGVRVQRVKSESDLLHVISHEIYGLNFVVIEVPSREINAAKLKEVTQSLVSAVRIGSNLA